MPVPLEQGDGERGPRRIPGVRRIAVLRGGGLGDLVMALPAIDSLAGAYPSAELTVLTGALPRAFLEGRPGPWSRVVALPRLRGVTAPDDAPPEALAPAGEVRASIEALRARRFDLAVQLHGGGRHSNSFLRALGARLTVGARTADAAPLDRWTPYVYHQHEPARWLEVAALAGGVPVSLEPRLAAAPADALALTEEAPALDGRAMAVIHPGAGDPARRWPAARFAEVGRALEAAAFRIAVVGSSAEADLTAEVTREVGAPALDLGGRLSPTGLAGLMERARILIGNDSGPRHLAAALGTPTVGVFWCSNVVNAAPLTRARQRVAIGWQTVCRRCGADWVRERCPHVDSLLDDVTVDEVLGQALELLSGGAEAEERDGVEG